MNDNIGPLQLIPEPAYLGQFVSQESIIRIEWFSPWENDERPIVLLLHGNGSLTPVKDDFYRRICQRFAEAGLQAGILHYFDLYGEVGVSAEQFQRGYFAHYALTISDAITYLQKKTTSKVALFGHSLGAQLALTEASVDSRVACLVSLSGSLCTELSPEAKLPPTFILHGDQDRAVSYEKVPELESILKQMGTPYEKRIYPGVGHNFDHATLIDAIERSAEYLFRILAANVEVPSLILDSSE